MSTITGTPADDILVGTAGDDTFKGLSGTDTALIASARGAAAFGVDATGRWSVTSGQGVDALESIELVQFTDRVVSLASVAGEQRVNTTTAGDQIHPSIAALADGGSMVVWASTDGSGSGIYGQRFDHDGLRMGGETRINTTTADEQTMPSVTALADGGFAVVWASAVQGGSVSDIYLQRFDASGAATGGETLVNATTAGGQTVPRIAALQDGGYVVAWLAINPSPAEWRIVTQRFDSSGTPAGAETLVDSLGVSSLDAVTGLSDGGYVVAWSVPGHSWGAGPVFLVQRFDQSGLPAGSLVGPEFFHANDLYAPDVAGLSDGGYVLVWAATAPLGSADVDPSSMGIYAQRFDRAGLHVGGVVLVNTTTPGAQSQPAVTALDTGGYVVAWESNEQDGSGTGIYLQRFDGSGARVGQEFLVNTTTDGSQSSPTISSLEGGGYVLGWVSPDGSGSGIYSQSFDASGLPKAPPPAADDTTAPIAIDFFPAGGSATLPPDWSLGITFSEAVKPGGGTITLQTQEGAVVQTFAPGDQGLHFVGASMVIDPAADLQAGTTYRLVVAPDAVEDLAGNAYAGVSGHTFTTAGSPPGPGPDTTAPAAIDFFPAAGSSTLPADWSLGITFSEAVKPGSGTITLKTEAGAVVQTFAAGDQGLHFVGPGVVIDPAADLQAGTTYRLVVAPDAVEDLAGNAYAGVSGHTFTTAGAPPGPGPDTTAPAAIDFFPAAGSTTLPPDWSLGITFSEAVKGGAGTITLQTAAGAVVQVFAAGDPGLQFSGASLIINPAADLQPGTTYRLVVAPDAVEDLAGNAYAGEGTHTFTAAGDQPQQTALVGVSGQVPADAAGL